jgi:hypothetical protein
MSRCAAVTEEIRTPCGPKTAFAFFGEEESVEGSYCGRFLVLRGWRAVPDEICYYVFLPLIEVDARCGLRYHVRRTYNQEDGSYEVW